MTTREAIDQALREYARVVPLPRQAIAGLTPEQMKERPGPGDWSIHEVVIHIVDSDIVSWDRMKRIATMERPSLIRYDETASAKTLFYHEQSLDDALALFEVGRWQMLRILERLPVETFDRLGVHSDYGDVSLFEMVGKYVDHPEHHVRFIDAKRERLGAPRVVTSSEKVMLENVLDGLDRLFDGHTSVIDLQALLLATAEALRETPHYGMLERPAADLLLMVRSGTDMEGERDHALVATDRLRHYLADLLPIE